jgi:hypothetical protein
MPVSKDYATASLSRDERFLALPMIVGATIAARCRGRPMGNRFTPPAPM